MKKISVIGSGMVGKVLASGFLKHGYDVMITSRDGSKLNEWKAANPKGNTGKFSDAAAFGDILVLAVKGEVAKDALKMCGNINGKIVIDTTNPISHTHPPKDGVLQYFTAKGESLMGILQQEFPAAHFVKAFNSIGNAYMVNPDFDGNKPSMFICGNSKEAKAEVSKILDLFGFEVEDMGTVEAAGVIEMLCILWCIPGFLENKWTHAFKLLKK